MIIRTKQTKTSQLSYIKRQFINSSILLSCLFLVIVAITIPDWVKIGFVWSFYDIMVMIYGILVPALIVSYVIIYRRTAKTDKISGENTYNYYEFIDEDNGITITTEIDGKQTGQTKLLYAQIYKIIETKKYYYIFLNATSVLVIRKEDLDAQQLTFVGNTLKQKITNYRTTKI